jgi:hypothetical protein
MGLAGWGVVVGPGFSARWADGLGVPGVDAGRSYSARPAVVAAPGYPRTPWSKAG